ncbi:MULTISPECIES: sugar ABC transporter permease [unclassified Paenibacillus]|uniref:carbohydrate ABC transporter permease n=1 Tax=unclassified Paenibacillus TaxID=185978 RepID=UPI000954FF53|nr:MULTISPECIES: sugar ABC transporter permease [unclassified Paenibacillus]ASS68029.1 sugar ABC transporter permease [Paenibacillus sp. RUD330]SIR41074.1 cellobiose transport system permease protein [Paenibacillus sp. RU4X]SIR51233.1 cellobiose transport system permease protein [Paenibacillus sp. RU4T]
MGNPMLNAEPARAPVPPRIKGSLASRLWRHRKEYLAISPFYILFAIFGLFPIAFSMYLSFQKWDGIGRMSYNGVNNYRFMLTDPEFWRAVGNTLLIWIYSTIPMLFIALAVAFLLNSSFVRFRTFYRIGYFLPNVTSLVAVAIVFGTIFSNNYGLLNYVLNLLGLNSIEWLNKTWGIQLAVSVMVIWRWAGYNAIIYLAGLQSIPSVLYEAAKIDGASTIQSFFRITIPNLRPIILFTLITSTIGGMQIFTEPQVLAGNDGGVSGGGLTIVLYLYREAFIHNYFGYGAAVGWGMFVLIALFSIVNWLFVQGGQTRGQEVK